MNPHVHEKKDLGYIIKIIKYSEADFIVRFLTRENGLVSVFAKSAGKSKNRFPCLDEMGRYQIRYRDKGSEKLGILLEATHPRFTKTLRQKTHLFAYASLIFEFLNKSLAAQNIKEAGEAFQLVETLLAKFEAGQNPAASFATFLIQYLNLQGVMANPEFCNQCRKHLATDRCYINVEEFHFLCAPCFEHKSTRDQTFFPVDQVVHGFVVSAYHGQENPTPSQLALKSLLKLSILLTRFHLQQYLRSERFLLDSIKKNRVG